jgi:hypothetical protein
MRNDFLPTALIGLFWLEKDATVLFQILLSTINALLTLRDEATEKYHFDIVLVISSSPSCSSYFLQNHFKNDAANDLRQFRTRVIKDDFISIEEFRKDIISMLQLARSRCPVTSQAYAFFQRLPLSFHHFQAFASCRALQLHLISSIEKQCQQFSVTSDALKYTTDDFERDLADEVASNFVVCLLQK